MVARHLHQHPNRISLELGKHYPHTQWLATEIQTRQKLKNKLPYWANNLQLLLADPTAAEQCSSAITAHYKTTLVANGHAIADLTGGLGVDLCYLAAKFKTAIAAEPNALRCALLNHNLTTLGLRHATAHQQTAAQMLQNLMGITDVVYLDPDRRTHDQRSFDITQHQPNVVQLWPLLKQKARQIIIKLSPMANINMLLQQLPGLATVVVVSVNNECKEILLIAPGNQMPQPHSPLIKATMLQPALPNATGNYQSLTIQSNQHQQRIALPIANAPLEFIFEPDVAIIKAGLATQVANTHQLMGLSPQLLFYTSNRIEKQFPGRVFQLIHTISQPKKQLKKLLPQGKVNIISRTHPLSANQIAQKYKLTFGGDNYLLAYRVGQANTMLLCKRVTTAQSAQ